MLSTVLKRLINWKHILSTTYDCHKIVSRYVHRVVHPTQSDRVPSELHLGVNTVCDSEVLVNSLYNSLSCGRTSVFKCLEENDLQA